MESLKDLLGLGVEPRDLGMLQVCVRSVIVFLATLVIVRLAHKRFLSRMTAFDAVLGFTLASVLARAINGSAPFFPTLVGSLLMVLLHRVLSALSFRWERFGQLVKGTPDALVKDGRPDRDKLRSHRISETDLLEEARLNGQVAELGQIRTAVLERNGKISVIPAKA